MVTHPHDILLRGLWESRENPQRHAPSILEFADPAFVERVLSEMASGQGLSRLELRQARNRERGVLRLYQPVHRIFHLAVLEATCFRPGEPRLNPADILGAGLVLRRIDRDGEKGWFKKDGVVIGWQPAPSDRESGRLGYDPDPALRRARRLGANAALLNRLEPAEPESSGFEEAVTPLFVAPPATCAAAHRTMLYGLVGVASAERAERPAATPVPFDDGDIRQRLPVLLKQGGAGRSGLPATRATVSRGSRGATSLAGLFDTLEYLAREVGLFTDHPAGERLRRSLAGVPLPDEWFPRSTGEAELRAMGDLLSYLRRGYAILFGHPEGTPGTTGLPPSIPTPSQWPEISAELEGELVAGIRGALQARWELLLPAQGRFDEPTLRAAAPGTTRTPTRYLIRAFIRVPCKPGCPPRTIWSGASEPFEIVPWHEASPVPPIQVELPEINRETLKKIRPNVAVKIPPSLQKFMDGMNLDRLLSGSVPKGAGEFGMICGLSIPIITLCAFIVLMIFLVLLNLVFWWLPFVKICIPYPKAKQ